MTQSDPAWLVSRTLGKVQTAIRVVDLLAAFGQFTRLLRLLCFRSPMKYLDLLTIRTTRHPAERATDLMLVSPELSFLFRILLTAEGQTADPSVIERLNEVLAKIQAR